MAKGYRSSMSNPQLTADWEAEALDRWLIGQVAGDIFGAVLLHGADFDETADGLRAVNDRRELSYDAPAAFTRAALQDMSPIERKDYRRLSGLWLEPADFDAAVKQARELVADPDSALDDLHRAQYAQRVTDEAGMDRAERAWNRTR